MRWLAAGGAEIPVRHPLATHTVWGVAAGGAVLRHRSRGHYEGCSDVREGGSRRREVGGVAGDAFGDAEVVDVAVVILTVKSSESTDGRWAGYVTKIPIFRKRSSISHAVKPYVHCSTISGASNMRPSI